MEVINWSRGENEGANYHEIATLDEFWQLVNTKFESECDPNANGVLEVSTNVKLDNTKYLVLSWVELEDE